MADMSDECRGLTREQIVGLDEAALIILRMLPENSGVFVLVFQADGQPDGWNFGTSNTPKADLLRYLQSWIDAERRKVQ